jgi:hypothetical protein
MKYLWQEKQPRNPKVELVADGAVTNLLPEEKFAPFVQTKALG